jgi:O-antigen biosynthesis protein WbqP
VTSSQRSYLRFRAVAERLLALILLAFCSPILLFVGLLIKVDSPGPVLFRQARAGRFHAPFIIYKFRTMKTGTPNLSTEEMQRAGLSPITRWGALFRRTSLDELPQLLNVLQGNMSFIGPRPALLSQTRVLTLRKAAGVDQLLPGITGYAQVTGRDDLEDEEKVRRDAEYMNRLGFSMDLLILKSTLNSVMMGTGNK